MDNFRRRTVLIAKQLFYTQTNLNISAEVLLHVMVHMQLSEEGGRGRERERESTYDAFILFSKSAVHQYAWFGDGGVSVCE